MDITKKVDVFWFLTVFPTLLYLIYLDLYFYKMGRRFLGLLNEHETGSFRDRVSHLALFSFSVILLFYILGKIFSYTYPFTMMTINHECSEIGIFLIRIA